MALAEFVGEASGSGWPAGFDITLPTVLEGDLIWATFQAFPGPGLFAKIADGSETTITVPPSTDPVLGLAHAIVIRPAPGWEFVPLVGDVGNPAIFTDSEIIYPFYPLTAGQFTVYHGATYLEQPDDLVSCFSWGTQHYLTGGAPVEPDISSTGMAMLDYITEGIQGGGVSYSLGATAAISVSEGTFTAPNSPGDAWGGTFGDPIYTFRSDFALRYRAKYGWGLIS